MGHRRLCFQPSRVVNPYERPYWLCIFYNTTLNGNATVYRSNVLTVVNSQQIGRAENYGERKGLWQRTGTPLASASLALRPRPPTASAPPVSRRRQRAAERVSAYRFARLVLPDKSQVKCIVKDISVNGAKVIIEGNFEIPQRVTLKIDQTGQTKIAGVVWQDETEVGLAFVH